MSFRCQAPRQQPPTAGAHIHAPTHPHTHTHTHIHKVKASGKAKEYSYSIFGASPAPLLIASPKRAAGLSLNLSGNAYIHKHGCGHGVCFGPASEATLFVPDGPKHSMAIRVADDRELSLEVCSYILGSKKKKVLQLQQYSCAINRW